MATKERNIKYIRQDRLFDSIAGFDPKHAVTRGEFSIDVQCLIDDMEWNHMDQQHRQFIHNTYNDNLRISLGRDFAVSLTRWGRWPFLITVTDVRADKGIYYQDFILAGLIYIHNTVTMEEREGDIIHLKLVWIINSHRFLKPLHWLLGKMFYKLNVRLQDEDAVIRSQRYRLRHKGYSFLSDPPDYYNANLLTNNTIYPALPEQASITLESLPLNILSACTLGNNDFVVKRGENIVSIWPAVCPHEGGELAKGKLHDNCRLECPWHGLKFTAAQLSVAKPNVEAYGFNYTLEGNMLHVRKVEKQSVAA